MFQRFYSRLITPLLRRPLLYFYPHCYHLDKDYFISVASSNRAGQSFTQGTKQINRTLPPSSPPLPKTKVQTRATRTHGLRNFSDYKRRAGEIERSVNQARKEHARNVANIIARNEREKAKIRALFAPEIKYYQEKIAHIDAQRALLREPFPSLPSSRTKLKTAPISSQKPKPPSTPKTFSEIQAALKANERSVDKARQEYERNVANIIARNEREKAEIIADFEPGINDLRKQIQKLDRERASLREPF